MNLYIIYKFIYRLQVRFHICRKKAALGDRSQHWHCVVKSGWQCSDAQLGRPTQITDLGAALEVLKTTHS